MVTSAARNIVASASILMATAAVAVPPAYTLHAGVGSEEFDDDPESFYYLAGSVLFSHIVSPNSIVDLQAEIATRQFSDDDLSEEEIFLQGTYNYTPRAGFRVPTYTAGLRLQEEFASDDDFDATTVTLLLALSYRLNDRTNVVGGLKFSQQDAGNLDSDARGIFFNLGYQYRPQWIFYATLDLESEEIDTGSSPAARAARGRAPAVGGHHTPGEAGFDAGSSANRDFDDADFDNTFITFGANYKIDAFNTLDFSVGRNEYDGADQTETSNIYSIDYFHRF